MDVAGTGVTEAGTAGRNPGVDKLGAGRGAENDGGDAGLDTAGRGALTGGVIAGGRETGGAGGALMGRGALTGAGAKATTGVETAAGAVA